jgi:RNA polymerase sigma factor (sigma-70 family)
MMPDPLLRYLVAKVARGAPSWRRAELLQDARIYAWKALSSYREGRGASLETWVTSQVTWRLRAGLFEARRRDPGVVPLEEVAYKVPDLAPTPETSTLRSERHARMRAVVSGRQWEVLEGRLAGGSLEEVGAQLGICRERVRQIEVSAVKRAREVLYAR